MTQEPDAPPATTGHPTPAPHDPTVQDAERATQALRGTPTPQDVDAAAALLDPLRRRREFAQLCELGELVCRARPDDLKALRLHTQGLIETGRLTAALGLLERGLRLAAELSPARRHAESAELGGLLGRANKQLFMDTPSSAGPARERYLRAAFDAYRRSYQEDPQANWWHGVNLAALAHLAARTGVALEGAGAAEDYATDVLARLDALPQDGRDGWWHATRAECLIALRDWPQAERSLSAFLADPGIPVFNAGSTLRQLRDIWRIQDPGQGDGGVGARLLQALEAVIGSRPGGSIVMSTQALVAARATPEPDAAQLQRVTGDGAGGLATLKWYRLGLRRAASVASIQEREGLRFGTGFAVRAADLGLEPPDETLLLTNWHVLNGGGLDGRTDFSNVEVVFEATDAGPVTCEVAQVLAESTADGGLDFALLRLRPEPGKLLPAPVRLARPPMVLKPREARVYVIGYPLGNEMQFSLQDNTLMDHECGDAPAAPPLRERRRLQYTASTKQGSSGSPVFDKYWDCVALHHAGPPDDKTGIPPLNGKSVYVPWNEGIWIESIREFLRPRSS